MELAGHVPRRGSVYTRVRRNLGGGRRLWKIALGADLRVPQKHLAPFGRFTPALEHAPIDERPAVEIMVHIAGQNEAVDERRVEEQLLEALQRPEPDQVATADAYEVLADVKVPVLRRGVHIADDLDVARVADAEAVLVRQ